MTKTIIPVRGESSEKGGGDQGSFPLRDVLHTVCNTILGFRIKRNPQKQHLNLEKVEEEHIGLPRAGVAGLSRISVTLAARCRPGTILGEIRFLSNSCSCVAHILRR